MHLTIVSIMADQRWTGDWTGEPDLDLVYRAFNRVDKADVQRLLQAGYLLPSLSSGDLVKLGGEWHLCASAGWLSITPTQAEAIAGMLPRAREQASLAGADPERLRPPSHASGHESGLCLIDPNGVWLVMDQDGATTELAPASVG